MLVSATCWVSVCSNVNVKVEGTTVLMDSSLTEKVFMTSKVMGGGVEGGNIGGGE